ncbi:hypothetical protein HDU93_008127 [Gonapodya sp. JEL0774]|nr:hypothetical protein HDU93_008127 [Gonapodya sp. JEL0774]
MATTQPSSATMAKQNGSKGAPVSSPAASASNSASTTFSLPLLLLLGLSLALHIPAYSSFLFPSSTVVQPSPAPQLPPVINSPFRVPFSALGKPSKPPLDVKPIEGHKIVAYKNADGLLGKPWSTLDEDPLLFVIDSFLRIGESEHLIELAKPLYSRSTVVSETDDETNKEFRVVSDYRTSSTAYLPRSGDPVIRCVEARAAAFSGYPVRNTESLQSVHYEEGKQYKVHHDWFPPQDPISAPHLLRGGQRVTTFFVYLNDVESGGKTWFPHVNVTGKPVTGNFGVDAEGGVSVAAFWVNVDPQGNGDQRTLHAGTPPLKGEKYGLNIWQRFGEFD